MVFYSRSLGDCTSPLACRLCPLLSAGGRDAGMSPEFSQLYRLVPSEDLQRNARFVGFSSVFKLSLTVFLLNSNLMFRTVPSGRTA